VLLKRFVGCFMWEYTEIPWLDRGLIEHRLPIKVEIDRLLKATFGFTFFPLFSRETRESTKIMPNAPHFSQLISPRLQLAEAICTAMRESCNTGKISIFVTTAWLQRAYSGSGNKHARRPVSCNHAGMPSGCRRWSLLRRRALEKYEFA
jgi:hypothetical protein